MHVPASCDQIPGVVGSFRGTLGSVDRPFAGPGDAVTVRISPTCDAASPGFAARPDAHVVTIAFEPATGIDNLVFVAADCGAIEDDRAACARRPGVASAACVETRSLAASADALQFEFPNTDVLLPPDGDDRGFAGPASIAVTNAGAPLPCELAKTGCGAVAVAGGVACIDRIFASGASCDLFAHETFGHFTALPVANDFRALCTTIESECSGAAEEVRLTVDADGNLLLPMDWTGILLGERVPFARQLRASVNVAAFPLSDTPLRLPGDGFLRSFSLRGGLLPAFFTPQIDPEDEAGLTLFGAADAPRTVLRIERRAAPRTSCDGGRNHGLPCYDGSHCPDGACAPGTCEGSPATPCSDDAECDGECGPALFDFSSRPHAGSGPLLIPRFGPGICESDGAGCRSDADCPVRAARATDCRPRIRC